MLAEFKGDLRTQKVLSPNHHSSLASKFMNRYFPRARNLFLLLFAAGSGLLFFLEDWQRDLTTNHAKLERSAKNPLLRPVTLSISSHEAAESVKQWVATQPRWMVVVETNNEDNLTLELTRTTRLFRFVDDVKIRFEKTNAGVEMHAESRSRVGKGDLGQNPRNLIEIVKALTVKQED
jgi:uncharacterized protein (DUF1499 family)